MEELVNVFPYLSQIPLVALVLWINRQHTRYMDEQKKDHKKEIAEQRERYLTYMEKRDDKLLGVLREHSETNRQISSDIKVLTEVITRLDTRLHG
jgi:hypothetical protein